MSDRGLLQPSPPRRLVALAATVTGMFTVSGLLTMWLLSPRVPYADSWRFLDHFLATPFPANVLAADNGHREVLPNAVRVVELHWCDANQLLQTSVGLALALLFVVLVWRTILPLPAAVRAAAAVVLAAGVFWLGNGRKLAHGSEALHLFAVLCCLLGGLRALAAPAARAREMVAAAALALVATFCFGSGLACFPAFAAVAVLQRRPWTHQLPLAGAALLALPGLLGGGDGTWPSAWSAGFAGELLLRLLGAASAWVFSPLLDPAHAARLPGGTLAALAGTVAVPAHAAFGPAASARWPAVAFGTLGLVWLAAASWRARARGAPAVAMIGLGLAWFATACMAMVAVLRLEYFVRHPEQITTQRYLPWSMLAWTGLLLARVATTTPRRALVAALLFAVVLLPSSVWTGRYAWKQRATAELTAAGAAVGVLDRDFPLEETVESELLHVLPALRAARTSVFAWREVAWLGEPLPAGAPREVLADVTVERVDNVFGPPGSRVSFRADGAGGDRLLVAGPDGRACGIVVRLPFSPWWRGWMLGTAAPGALTAAAAP